MLIFTHLVEGCKSSQFSKPFSKKTSVVSGMIRMMAVLLVGLFIQVNSAQAQVPVEPCPNCVSEDIKLIEVTFKDYNPATCPKAGTPINEDSLRISFYVTSKYRYGLLFLANLYIDGQYKGILYNCYGQTFEQGYREVFIRLPDSLYGKFNAGTKIEVKNVFTAWDNNKPSGKNAGNYRVCNAYNYATNTYDCKMMQDGNSLTPKCKFYSQAFQVKAPAKPEITFDSSKNVTCYGGSNGAIYISVAPTTQDYTYTWTKGGITYGTSEDLTGAPAGTFTVTANAQGCTATLSKEITQPAEFKATTSTIKTTCYDSKDGKAIVKAEGGTAPYTYSWSTTPAQTSDTATGLERGSYTVTITDANGCQISRVVTVGSPTQVGFTVTYNPGVSCYGGSDGKVKFRGTGGTGSSYTFSWNGGEFSNKDSVVGVSAGKYGLTVKDSLGCTRTDSITVTQPTKLRFSSVTKQNINCYGDSTGSISVTMAGGTSPYKYKFDTSTSYKNTTSWSHLGPGTYALSVKDANGCLKDTSFTISQPAAALSATKDSINVKCRDESTGRAWVVVSGGTPNSRGKYYYSWSPSGGNQDTAKNLAAGTYTVTITDSLHCTLTKRFVIKQPNIKISDTIKVVKPVTCYGGSDGIAMVQGRSGTPYTVGAPYRYLWSTSSTFLTTFATTDTIKNLTARTYYVRVTDSLGCSITDSKSVPGPTHPLEVFISVGDDYDSLCLGDTAVLKLDSTKGGTPYRKLGARFEGYRYVISKILGANTVTYNDTTYITTNAIAVELRLPWKGPGNYIVRVTDSLGCTATDTVNIVDKECYKFCNYSQGYFGNPGGLSSFNYDTVGCLTNQSTRAAIDSSLKWWDSNFVAGLEIGDINLRVTYGTGATDAILDYLPGGGPIRQWDLPYFPPPQNDNAQGNTNTLVNQLLTLGLNIGINSGMYNFRLYDSEIILQHFTGDCSDGIPIAGECYSFHVETCLLHKSIGEIFEAASTALVSGSDEERHRYAEICGYLNESFHGCARPVLYCDAPYQESFNDNYVSNQLETQATNANQLAVKAFPNPYTDNVYFRFKSPVNGDALLEIFDFSGRRLAVQRKSNILAGEVNQMMYLVPQSSRSQLIYKLSIGKYNAKGILIAPSVE